MRIKSQYLLSIIIFIAILAIIFLSVVITNQQVTKINTETQNAGIIQTGANNLVYISNDYFLYQQTLHCLNGKPRFLPFQVTFLK